MHPSWIAASCSRIGGRQSQEDRLVSIPDLNACLPEANRSELDPPRSFFGIFDGHGGHACSDFLAKKFHTDLAQSPLLQSDPKAALLEVWGDLDRQFYDICNQVARDRAEGRGTAGGARYAEGSFPRDGSTATVLLLVGSTLFAANCGDSAGILVRKNGIVQSLTTNHDTLNPHEFDRVQRCGGFYRQQTLKTKRRWPLCCFEQDTVVGKPRVYPGGLLVTRSFGDFSAKVLTLGGKPGVILPDCEDVLELTVEEDWAELIIASDGIWDVMAPKEMPRLLAKPDGTGRRKATAAPLTDVEGESAAGGVHEGTGGGGDAEESTWTEDTWKLEQAQLSGTCAKMVMACVRHRYWSDNQAVPDNASAVILRFFAPETREQTAPPHHQPPVAADPVDDAVDDLVSDPVGGMAPGSVVVPPVADPVTAVETREAVVG